MGQVKNCFEEFAFIRRMELRDDHEYEEAWENTEKAYGLPQVSRKMIDMYIESQRRQDEESV